MTTKRSQAIVNTLLCSDEFEGFDMPLLQLIGEYDSTVIHRYPCVPGWPLMQYQFDFPEHSVYITPMGRSVCIVVEDQVLDVNVSQDGDVVQGSVFHHNATRAIGIGANILSRSASGIRVYQSPTLWKGLYQIEIYLDQAKCMWFECVDVVHSKICTLCIHETISLPDIVSFSEFVEARLGKYNKAPLKRSASEEDSCGDE